MTAGRVFGVMSNTDLSGLESVSVVTCKVNAPKLVVYMSIFDVLIPVLSFYGRAFLM